MRLFNRVLLSLMATCSALQAIACDVCGSVSGSQTLGLLPQFSKHFAGLQYQYSSSESSHPSIFEGKPDEKSSQTYTTAQVWGRYQIANSIQLFGFLPYIRNVNNEASQMTNNNGLGDATLMANFSVPIPENKKWKRLLLAGAGIKLPTGKYTGISNSERNGLPGLQTGTGSWDFPINVNYTQKAAKWGYNFDASYLLTTANKEQYKFGNRLNTAVMAFYWVEKKSFKIVPQAGLRCEYSLHDYDNYRKKWLNEKTGGTMCFVGAGTQIFYKKMGFKAAIHIPVYQNFAAGYVHSNARIEGGLFLLF